MEDSEAYNKREKLKDFYFLIRNCSRCELHKTRTNFVFGSGNSNSPVIFVGEAPGKNEDLQGKPFVGQAGKLLDELLESIGFARKEVFIANVLKCRPPLNRDPSEHEINTCKEYLFRQIEIINPRVVCTMGRYSTQLILDTDTGINKLRGNIYKRDGRVIIPINHPAAAIYTPSRMQILREDFKKLKSILDNTLNPGEFSEISGTIPDSTSSPERRGGVKGNGKKDAAGGEEPAGQNSQLELF